MTVAATKDYEFTIDKIVRNAYRLASLMGPEQAASGVQWEAQAQYGREMLEMLVKQVQAEGKLIRAWGFYELTVSSGTSDYTLPTSVLDVFEEMAYLDPGGDSETPIRQIDLQAWQRLGTRTSVGRPSLYYAHRKGSAVEVRFYPTPDETATVRMQAYELFADVTPDGTKTVELERHWALYLTYALAMVLAESANLGAKVARLAPIAASLLQKAKAYSHQRTPNQMILVHSGGVYGGR